MPRPTEPVAVRHPLTGQFETLNPGADYPDDDEMVLAYPWAFAPRDVESGVVESVEVATAEPGQKRTRGRAKK